MSTMKKEIKVKVGNETFQIAVQKALEALRLARIAVVRPEKYPYFAPMAFSSRFVTKVFYSETIAIDANLRIYFNPFFILLAFHRDGHSVKPEDLETFIRKLKVDDLDFDALALVLRHEYEHVFRRHFERAEAIKRTGTPEWNIAADLEINSNIQHPFFEWFAWTPQKLNLPPNLSAEEYLTLIPPQPTKPSDGGDDDGEGVTIEVEGGRFVGSDWKGDAGSGAGMPIPEELDPDDKEAPGISDAQRENAIEGTAREIIEHAKHRGNIPGDLVRLAEKMLKGKVDWRRALDSIIRKTLAQVSSQREEYTFSKTNRRQDAYNPFIFPATVGYEPRKIAVVIDTSGSMSDNELSQCVAEALAIIRNCNADLDVIACDAAVQSIKRNVQSRNDIVNSLKGGGGTDMRVGIEEAIKLKPDAIVVLTDGYTPFPTERPPVPLIVGILFKGEYSGNEPPSFARVVEIDLSD